MSQQNLFLGRAALTLGMTESRLRTACNRGVIDPPKVGNAPVFPADKMSEYREKLTAAGYLEPVTAAR